MSMPETNHRPVPTLVVRGIVFVCMTIVIALALLAISNYPTQWRAQVDAERYRALEVIAQALQYRALDYDGILQLPDSPRMISTTDACTFYCPMLGAEIPCMNAQTLLVPGYMHKIPRDPFISSDHESGYYLSATDTGFVVGACNVFFNGPLIVEQAL